MSKSTNQGATTVKVSTNTGAAKDETFAGFNEDNARANLDVLANDPGSAKLWSLDQNALNAPLNSQQPQNLNAFTLASGATISVNADGTVKYDGSAALQWLAAGETYRDSFIYTIRMANGALSTARATVDVLGVNDAATFAGDKSGTLTEDSVATSGKLTVSDVDHDQGALQAATQNGSFGKLVTTAAGNWAYTLTADMNYLQAGEVATESFTVKSVDGTEQVLKQTILGVNDVATFSGDTSGTLTEDAAATSGKLLVSDLDHDQSALQAATQTGSFGKLATDAAGNWTYTVTADMNYLQAGESVTESFIVKSVDGTEQVLTQVITGVNDVAVIGGVATGSVQEDGVIVTGGTLTVIDLDHDQGAFASTSALAGNFGDFSFDLGTGAWTYALRNGAANVQALVNGQGVQDKLQVTTIDGTASELVVTIGGADEPVVITNPADKWVVNKQNVTKTGGGLHIGFENGIAKIVGFDGNDTLHTTSLDKDNPFIQLVDTDNNGSLDSTLLNFSYEQGQNTHHIDVILVGYTEFSTSQLFHG